MITFRIEKIDQIRKDIEPLLTDHYLEIATNKDIKPLSIDWKRYYDLEENGALHIVSARNDVLDCDTGRVVKKGILVGYCVSFLISHPHYSENLMAMNDILYVDPSYRKGTVAYRLLKYAENELKSCGASILTLHMKIEHPFRELTERLGYFPVEEIWEKVL